MKCRWSRWAGKGIGSEESRVSEAAVRGFWKTYRGMMGIVR